MIFTCSTWQSTGSSISLKVARRHSYMIIVNAIVVTLRHCEIVLVFVKGTYWKSACFSENTRI